MSKLISILILALIIFAIYKLIIFIRGLIQRWIIKRNSRLYYILSFGFENEKLKYAAISTHVLYQPVDVVDYPERLVLHFLNPSECSAAYDFITSREFEFKKLDYELKKKGFKTV